jgi:murein DD-endopeptidase MepM/ murein hydrolase activator NlpD
MDQGGNATGIGNYVRQLDAAGVPAVVMCNNDIKGIDDALKLIESGSAVPHVMVHRVVKPGMDVPNYSTSPFIAARDYYDLLIPHVHNRVKLHRDKVWVQLGNELDKNRAEWIAEWAMESHLLWSSLGYRGCVINWSTGEPEPEHWRTPAMLHLLRLCAAERETLAIGLHEYSLDDNNILTGSPYLVGRYADLIDACEENGIGHPSMLITEFGWEQWSVPPTANAAAQIEGITEGWYGKYPTILGAGLWYLGTGWQGIADKVNKLIVPVTEQAKNYTAPPQVNPDPSVPPANPDESFDEFYWRRSVEEQTVSLNPDALLQSKIDAAGYNIVEGEFWDAYDNNLHAAQAGEHLQTGDRKVWITPVPAMGDPWLDPFTINNPQTDVLHGFTIAAPFARPFMLTDKFDAWRSYANNKHEGCDYDILTVAVDSTEPVLCGIKGRVVAPQPLLSGYGNHVVVEGVHRGQVVLVWYGHMDALYVAIGDEVDVGTQLGEIGDTGGNFSEHIHVNLQVPGHGLSGYVVPDVVNPEPYIAGSPQSAGQHDMGEYFLPVRGLNIAAGMHFGDIVILANSWGQGDERQQLQSKIDHVRPGGNLFSYVTKNAQYEQRWVTPSWIDLELDTSPDGTHYYEVDGHWLPRHMQLGQTFARTETVRHYRKSDCQKTNEVVWSSLLKFASYFQRHRIEDSGLEIAEVIELRWLLNGQIIEHYFYAKNLGLVAWKNNDGRHSWATEIIPRGNQNDNQMEVISCL